VSIGSIFAVAQNSGSRAGLNLRRAYISPHSGLVAKLTGGTMKPAKAPLLATFIAYGGTWSPDVKPGPFDRNDSAGGVWWSSAGMTTGESTRPDSQPQDPSSLNSGGGHDHVVATGMTGLTLAEFVEQVFVPEHAAAKRPAGRAHLQGILKHVLMPVQVNRAFGVERKDAGKKAGKAHGWPYAGTMRLPEIRPQHVQAIVSAALERGYSTQTIRHIHSVVSLVFSHALKSGHLLGENPANGVVLPPIVPRERHTLSADQLAELIRVMRYPEREIALLATLTGMTIGEICGLQWKYVNLSESQRMVDGESIRPRTIALRKQSSRCELHDVKNNRRRELPISGLLQSVLQGIKRRSRSTAGRDFVLSSRNGTPINQDNVAARRLKQIGRRHNMPWLTWQVFHRTHSLLHSRWEGRFEDELQNALQLNASPISTGTAASPGGKSRLTVIAEQL
jgi:integrase